MANGKPQALVEGAACSKVSELGLTAKSFDNAEECLSLHVALKIRRLLAGAS